MGQLKRYENVKIADLTPYENNARTHSDEQIDKIARSIKEFGFINPVIVDTQKGIIAGHGRVLGAKQLGMNEVPCIFVENLTNAQKRAYIIADNKLALDAGWDDEILRNEIFSLDKYGYDISFTGFDLNDFDVEQDDIEFDEDIGEAPQLPTEAKSKTGEIYRLGNHRLMCGDSTNSDNDGLVCNGSTIQRKLRRFKWTYNRKR